jgi:predicted DNA-binding transcriptional regulator AlpA|tara:strand:- start:1284 stop:1502 length:219 start_codon:yes stop_codon:yes gene_type:complete
MTSPSEQRKLLKIAEITEWLGVSHSTIYKWVSEDIFPQPIYLGPGKGDKNSATRWVEEEVLEWLAQRPRGKE